MLTVGFLNWARFINCIYVGNSIEVRPLFIDQYEEGCTGFPNMGAISKFQEPGGWCEASSILKTHKYWASPCKIVARRPVICTPLNERL